MIFLTNINGKSTYFLNPDLIEQMYSTPNTTIRLRTGNKYLCKESPEEVIEKIVAFKQRCNSIEICKEGSDLNYG